MLQRGGWNALALACQVVETLFEHGRIASMLLRDSPLCTCPLCTARKAN
jgi:hypothetical protein